MEENKMKNIVVLKNLPSNLVEEAIVILKRNQRTRELELLEKQKSKDIDLKEPKDKEYILKEAELLISECFDKVEEKRQKQNQTMFQEMKYNKLKKYSICISICLFISLICNFI